MNKEEIIKILENNLDMVSCRYVIDYINELEERIDDTLEICDDVLMRGYDIDDDEYDKGEYDIALAVYKTLRGEE